MVFFFHTQHLQAVEKQNGKIYQQHADFYFKFLRIIHQIVFVLPVKFHIVLLSQEYATQDVYLLLKENFSEFSCAELVFFQPKTNISSHSRSDYTFNITNMHAGQQKAMTYIIRYVYILHFI